MVRFFDFKFLEVALNENAANAAGGGFLTVQLGPGGRAVDGVNRVTAETIIQQLPISNPKAQ